MMQATVHRKYLAGRKLADLVNHELFAKIFLTSIHRYTKNVLGNNTDCSLFAKIFLLLTWFTKIFPRQIFPVYSIWLYASCSYCFTERFRPCITWYGHRSHDIKTDAKGTQSAEENIKVTVEHISM